MITMLLNRAAMVESLLWFPVPFRKVCLRWALEIDLYMKQLRMKRRRRGKRPITETDRRLCIKSSVFRFTYAVRYNVNHVIRISSHSCPGPEILVRNLKQSILSVYIKSILNETPISHLIKMDDKIYWVKVKNLSSLPVSSLIPFYQQTKL